MYTGDISMIDVFIGRQPIFTQDLEVFAFELLYRMKDNTWSLIENGAKATSLVIINAFLEIGLENIVGEKLECGINAGFENRSNSGNISWVNRMVDFGQQ